MKSLHVASPGIRGVLFASKTFFGVSAAFCEVTGLGRRPHDPQI